MIRMCEDIVGDHDTDLAELLLSKPGRAKVEQELCHNLSSVCSRKPPKFSGPRPDGEDFEEVDLEELQMQRMMAMMQDQGMSGNVCPSSSVYMWFAAATMPYLWLASMCFLTCCRAHAASRPCNSHGADGRVPEGDGRARIVYGRHFKHGWRIGGRRAVAGMHDVWFHLVPENLISQRHRQEHGNHAAFVCD